MERKLEIKAPTVNNYEMSFFKRLSSSWWDFSTQMYTLFILNRLRIPWVIEKLMDTKVITNDSAESSNPLLGIKILDVGCGGGYATEAFAEFGATVIGIDPCGDLIEEAKRRQIHNQFKNITYIHGSLETHWEDNSEEYDVIFASEVVDHVDNQELFLEMCSRCLKPGGSMFVTTFNKTWLAWFVIVFIFEYVTFTIPKGAHSYYNFISPEEVERILKNSNCDTKSVKGFFYNFFAKRWVWISCTWISYALHAVKRNNK